MRVDGKVYGYAPSFTEYEFITNLPPYGGTCMIDPPSGIFIISVIVIDKPFLNVQVIDKVSDSTDRNFLITKTCLRLHMLLVEQVVFIAFLKSYLSTRF